MIGLIAGLKEVHLVHEQKKAMVILPHFSLIITPYWLMTGASVAIMPVVVGLLAGLASKHLLAVDTKSGMSCLTPTWNRILPREKISLDLLQEEPARTSGAT